MGVEEYYACVGEIGIVEWKWNIIEFFCFAGKEKLQLFFIAHCFIRTTCKEALYAFFYQLGKLWRIGVFKQLYLLAVALAEGETHVGSVSVNAALIQK